MFLTYTSICNVKLHKQKAANTGLLTKGNTHDTAMHSGLDMTFDCTKVNDPCSSPVCACQPLDAVPETVAKALARAVATTVETDVATAVELA